MSHPRARPARLDRLRIRHLRLLELVVETGSLTGAAGLLGISQPAATKMLQELEHAFGCTLIDRSTRGGVISSAGERVLERLAVALGMLEAASQTLAAKPLMPLLRIGVLRFAGVELIPDIVADLHASATLPRIRLYEGSASQLMEKLEDGEIDCAIGRLELDSLRSSIDAFEVVPLIDEHYEVACAPTHPLAAQREVPWRTLQQYPWILPPPTTYTWRVFESGFRSRGMAPPQPLVESPSFHDSVAIVARTDMLVLAPRSAVAYYQELGRICRIDLRDPYPVDYAVLMMLKSVATLPAMQAVRDALLRSAVTRTPGKHL